MALEPPAYTGVEPSTVKGGDLRVIEGTDATFRIAFDSPPAEASLVMTDPVRPLEEGQDGSRAAGHPARSPSGTTYTAGLKLTKGLVYQIEARTADGRVLPKNRYKIEVLEDRAPRVAFEQPDEALEVHPIAEVLNRIRVGRRLRPDQGRDRLPVQQRGRADADPQGLHRGAGQGPDDARRSRRRCCWRSSPPRRRTA